MAFDRTLDYTAEKEPEEKYIESIEELQTLSYEEIREICVSAFKTVGRDDLVFDLNMIDKPLRVKLLSDPVYKARTKAIRAKEFRKQISTLHGVLDGKYIGDDTGDQSKNKLAAVSALNDLIFQDVNKSDEDAKLNLEFIAMSRQEFIDDEKVEIQLGDGEAGDLTGGESDDKESQLKLAAKKMVEAEGKHEAD